MCLQAWLPEVIVDRSRVAGSGGDIPRPLPKEQSAIGATNRPTAHIASWPFCPSKSASRAKLTCVEGQVKSATKRVKVGGLDGGRGGEGGIPLRRLQFL